MYVLYTYMNKQQHNLKMKDLATIVIMVLCICTGSISGNYHTRSRRQEIQKNQYENGEFAWNHKITDGVLTYMVLEGNDMMFKKMVDSAVLEWEEALDEVIVFEKIKYGDADITFDEVSQRSLGKDRC